MKINLDEIKQELQETRKLISPDLSDEELVEINIFIDSLVEDLQKSFEKINNVKFYEAVKKYIKEKSNV